MRSKQRKEKEQEKIKDRKRTQAALQTYHYIMHQYLVKQTNIFLIRKIKTPPTTIEDQLHNFPHYKN